MGRHPYSSNLLLTKTEADLRRANACWKNCMYPWMRPVKRVYIDKVRQITELALYMFFDFYVGLGWFFNSLYIWEEQF